MEKEKITGGIKMTDLDRALLIFIIIYLAIFVFKFVIGGF
jgi:hypothetical protein